MSNQQEFLAGLLTGLLGINIHILINTLTDIPETITHYPPQGRTIATLSILFLVVIPIVQIFYRIVEPGQPVRYLRWKSIFLIWQFAIWPLPRVVILLNQELLLRMCRR